MGWDETRPCRSGGASKDLGSDGRIDVCEGPRRIAASLGLKLLDRVRKQRATITCGIPTGKIGLERLFVRACAYMSCADAHAVCTRAFISTLYRLYI